MTDDRIGRCAQCLHQKHLVKFTHVPRLGGDKAFVCRGCADEIDRLVAGWVRQVNVAVDGFRRRRAA